MKYFARTVPRAALKSIVSVLNGFTTGTINFFACLWCAIVDQYAEISSPLSGDSWILIWKSFSLQALLFVMLHTAFHRLVLPFNKWMIAKLNAGKTVDQKWLWNICFVLWLVPALAVCRIYSMKAFQIVFQRNWSTLTGTRRVRARSTGSHVESVMSVLTPGLTYWSLFLLEQAYNCRLLVPVYALAYSFLYSFYAFNYPWTAKSVDFFTQCVKMSHNWPYFIGFSFPFTALVSSLSTNIAFGSLAFTTLFPFMILSASVASSRNMDTKTSAPFAFYVMQPGLLISLLMIYLFSSAMNILRPLPAVAKSSEQGNSTTEAENVKCELAKAFGHGARTQNAAISAVWAPGGGEQNSDQFEAGGDDNDDSAYVVIDSNLDERLVRRQ